jgi:hypothetical protein
MRSTLQEERDGVPDVLGAVAPLHRRGRVNHYVG